MNTITQAEATKLRALFTEADAWVESRRARNREGWTPEELPKHLQACDNDERAKLELYDFMHGKPEKLCAYYHQDVQLGSKITNWTGLLLGNVVRAGNIFTSNFGDKRRYVTVQAVNGCTYKGVAQLSGGTYVRLRKV